MIEHVFHLNRSNAWQREGRETILIKEINAVCFNRIYGRTAAKFAYEKDRVDMVSLLSKFAG
jgi:nuclear transport factor 2 (NTF2) superfamily protein